MWLTGDAKNRIKACDPEGVLGSVSISSLREIAPPREVYFKTFAWIDIERFTPRDKSAAIEALPVGTTFISDEDMALQFCWCKLIFSIFKTSQNRDCHGRPYFGIDLYINDSSFFRNAIGNNAGNFICVI